MADSPRVSVVIPCYRQAHFLPAAIESVLEQGDWSAEIVVVDDGSPDDVAAAASPYPARCIHQDNRGLAGARNTGLRASSGEFLVFLDADDRLCPGAFAAALEWFQPDPNLLLVWGRCEFIDRGGRPCDWVEPDGRRLGESPPYTGKEPYRDLLKACLLWSPASAMFRRNAFAMLGEFAEAVGPAADWDMYLRIARTGSVASHHALVAQYRLHGENMTRGHATMLDATMRMLRDHKAPAARDRETYQAWRQGWDAARRYYGEPLAAVLRERAATGHLTDEDRRGIALLRAYLPEALGDLSA